MTASWKDAREHAVFAGDGMLLIVPVAGILVGAGMNLFIGIGQGGIGFVGGAVLAVAATPIVVWFLRQRNATRVMWIDAAVSALLVAAAAGGAYALVVTNELDQSSGFSTVVWVVLGIEAIVALGLVVDSIIDLARGRKHTAMDVIRLVVLALVTAVLAVFSQNPDFGVVLLVLAALCLAGAVAAALGDGLLTLQERPSHNQPS